MPGRATSASCRITSSGRSCSADGDELTLDLFPPQVRGLAPLRVGRRAARRSRRSVQRTRHAGHARTPATTTSLLRADRVAVEKELILQVLRTCQGVQTKAATRLGINRNTLHKKIEDYGLDSEPQ